MKDRRAGVVGGLFLGAARGSPLLHSCALRLARLHPDIPAVVDCRARGTTVALPG